MNANKIRAKIVERGMTQGEVAKKIGISPNSLSRKLLGKRDFSLSEVLSLCAVLEIEDPQDIFLRYFPKYATTIRRGKENDIMSGLSRYEQETIINFNEGEDTASVYTHNKTLLRKLEQLARERPDECRLFKTCRNGQAAEYYIPKRWLKIRPTRILSEEERATRAEAARKAFSRPNSPLNNGVGEVPPADEGKDTTPDDVS